MYYQHISDRDLMMVIAKEAFQEKIIEFHGKGSSEGFEICPPRMGYASATCTMHGYRPSGFDFAAEYDRVRLSLERVAPEDLPIWAVSEDRYKRAVAKHLLGGIP